MARARGRRLFIPYAKLAYIIAGASIAMLRMLTPLFIFLMVPAGILAMIRKDRAALIALLIASFLAVMVPSTLFMHYTNPAERERGWGPVISDHFDAIYTGLLSDVTPNDANSGAKQQGQNIDFLRQKKLFTFEDDSGPVSFAVDSSGGAAGFYAGRAGDQTYAGNWSFRISFDAPASSDVTVSLRPEISDFSEYNYLILHAKPEGRYGMLEIVLEDKDGDWWHYFDDDLLQKQGWQTLKIDMRQMKSPVWTMHGNGVMDLDSIKRVIINLNAPENRSEAGIFSLYLDDFYLVR